MADKGHIPPANSMERGYLNRESQPIQPLRIATCSHCGAKFFFANPEPSRQVIRAQTHLKSPKRGNHSAILPYDCLHCKQHQFIEIFYEGYAAGH
jgi:DNA-directed RNA polymerase subunit RPC12/RpoP